MSGQVEAAAADLAGAVIAEASGKARLYEARYALQAQMTNLEQIVAAMEARSEPVPPAWKAALAGAWPSNNVPA